MSGDFVMDETRYGRIGFQKLDTPHPDFHWYCAESLGSGRGEAVKLDGCQYRAAKSGPRKGLVVVPVPGTKKTVIVTRSEIEAFSAESTSKDRP